MKNTFILLLGIFVILITSCNKDEPVACTDETNIECPNYNPCLEEKLTNADFETATILVSTAHAFISVKEDSFYLGTPVLFTAKEEDVLSYEWTVGEDERVFTEREFSLNFSLSDSVILLNRPFPIQLIVTRTPNTDCFPSDDGIDTITKNIYFISQFEQSHKQLKGIWIGSMEHELDKVYEIEMYEEASQNGRPWQNGYYNLIINNLDNDGDGSCGYEINSVAYSSFYENQSWIQNLSECQRSSGIQPSSIFGKIDKNGDLRIEWVQRTLVDGTYENLERVFNGRRK
ncbi:MAG: hypothetical protein AB8G11_01870 [Saprospiraceae bacterium]